MANSRFDIGRVAQLTAAINLLTDDIRAVLVDSTYVVDLTAHQHLSDIASGKRVGTPVRLTTPSVSASGVFDADDVTYPALANTGQTILAVVLYKNTGVESTSTLWAYIDTGAGFPASPTGSDFVVRWSNGSTKIYTEAAP